MNANTQWHAGNDQQDTAEQLARALVAQLDTSIAQNGSAVIALSGGSTPKPLFKVLAEYDLDWSNVFITLVDERWVDESHELSNAAFMRRYLLDGLPSDVNFIPLYAPAESAQASVDAVLSQYCEQTNSSLEQPRAFDVVVLGMGGDGHTASFFPDADNVAELIDPNNENYLLTCHSPSTQVARITWSLPMLLNTSLLALHITGENKKQVFEQATSNGSSEQIARLPIRSAIFQEQTPLNVYYAD